MDFETATPALLPSEISLNLGRKVRIRAIKNDGSARVLHGLMARIIGTHPLAANWCKIELEANNVTPHIEWSIAVDRLIPVE